MLLQCSIMMIIDEHASCRPTVYSDNICMTHIRIEMSTLIVQMAMERFDGEADD